MRGIRSGSFLWRSGLGLSLGLLCLPLVAILAEVRGGFLHELLYGLVSDYSINTLLLILRVSSLSLIFGVIPAWLVSNYKFPMAGFFGWALALPLAIPAYIMAYVYKGVFGVYGTSHALTGLFFEVDNAFMLSVVMALSLYPYVYLSSRTTFLLTSGQFNRVSFSLGAGTAKTFLRVLLPLSWPGIFAGLGFVVMEVLNNYGAVKYYGVNTFTTEIVRRWNPVDKAPVHNISAVLIVLTALFFLLENFVRKRAGFTDRHLGMEKSGTRTLSGGNKLLAFLICLIPFALGFGLPVLQLIAWSFGKWHLFLNGEMMNAVATSFMLGATAGICCVLLALIVRFYLHYRPERLLSGLDRLVSLGYAIPGALTGVGILSLLHFTMKLTGLYLTTSLAVLLFAYGVRFYAVAGGAFRAGFEKIPASLVRSSVSLGKSLSSTLLKIHIPLLGKVCWTGVILVFVDCLKELPLTMMFQQFNFSTLAVKAFTMMERDGAIYDASLPSLLIVAISVVPVILVNRLLKR